MTLRKLDKERPYGLVYGSGNAKYEQAGKVFDHSGIEIPGSKGASYEDPKVEAKEEAAAKLKDENEELRRMIAELKGEKVEEEVHDSTSEMVEMNSEEPAEMEETESMPKLPEIKREAPEYGIE